MFAAFFAAFKQRVFKLVQQFQQVVKRWLTPQRPSLTLGTARDLVRSRKDLIIENALLRQQLVVVARQVKRPQFTTWDRLLMVWLTSLRRGWQQALVLIQPDTLLRWHRDLFKRFWTRKSQHTGGKLPLAAGVVVLIQRMAKDNPLWGAERIRGELLKLGYPISKSTIQKYLPKDRSPRATQTWATFLHNHADQLWACDFIHVTDLLFRSLFVFVMVELGSRRVVQVGVTRHPTDGWVAQQVREATPFGEVPRFLLCDNDSKYGPRFEQVVAGSAIELLRTPIRAPKANAVCERFVGSVRRECLDHMLIISEAYLRWVMKAYVTYFNGERPHQGIGQRIPGHPEFGEPVPSDARIIAQSILGGLHHAYRWQAA